MSSHDNIVLLVYKYSIGDNAIAFEFLSHVLTIMFHLFCANNHIISPSSPKSITPQKDIHSTSHAPHVEHVPRSIMITHDHLSSA